MEYDNLTRELFESNPLYSHFIWSLVSNPKPIMERTLILLQEFEKKKFIEYYRILHQQATIKEKRKSLALNLDTNCEIVLLCQKNDSYTNLVYSKDTFGTLLTISQRFNFSEFPFTDLLPPFNIPDSLGVPSFLFLFSFQRATPYFLYILERQSPILFYFIF